jgi:hypothetical protein
MLLIHGGRDGYIPVDQSQLLYALSAQPKHLWVVPGARHNQSVEVRPSEYARRTVDFFDRYLARRPDPNNMYNEGRFEAIARLAVAARLESAPASSSLMVASTLSPDVSADSGAGTASDN